MNDTNKRLDSLEAKHQELLRKHTRFVRVGACALLLLVSVILIAGTAVRGGYSWTGLSFYVEGHDSIGLVAMDPTGSVNPGILAAHSNEIELKSFDISGATTSSVNQQHNRISFEFSDQDESPVELLSLTPGGINLQHPSAGEISIFQDQGLTLTAYEDNVMSLMTVNSSIGLTAGIGGDIHLNVGGENTISLRQGKTTFDFFDTIQELKSDIEDLQDCCQQTSCSGDFNHNGQVDINDLLEFLTYWGPCT